MSSVEVAFLTKKAKIRQVTNHRKHPQIREKNLKLRQVRHGKALCGIRTNESSYLKNKFKLAQIEVPIMLRIMID